VEPNTILILCLLAFIVGLIVGVILGKPGYPPRY
jgi:hypothetical protein